MMLVHPIQALFYPYLPLLYTIHAEISTELPNLPQFWTWTNHILPNSLPESLDFSQNHPGIW